MVILVEQAIALSEIDYFVRFGSKADMCSAKGDVG